MYFENITYVPIDLDAIDPDQMTSTERNRLNAYHENVYRVVSPFLEGEELAWLLLHQLRKYLFSPSRNAHLPSTLSQ